MTPVLRFFLKFLSGLFTGWLILIWTGNLANPGWLRPDTESLLAIPALALWALGFWEEILQFARDKKQPEAGPPAVQATVQNILSVPPPAPLPEILPNTPGLVRYDTSNRQIDGPNDPLLDPWLGAPLHGRDREIEQLAGLLAAADTDIQVIHPLVLAEGGVGKTELCKAALRRYLGLHPLKKPGSSASKASPTPAACGNAWLTPSVWTTSARKPKSSPPCPSIKKFRSRWARATGHVRLARAARAWSPYV